MNTKLVSLPIVLSILSSSHAFGASAGAGAMDVEDAAAQGGAGSMPITVAQCTIPYLGTAESSGEGSRAHKAIDVSKQPTPIKPSELTFGRLCEEFAVNPSVNGQELHRTDAVFATLRGVDQDTLLSLKGLKPFLPFSK